MDFLFSLWFYGIVEFVAKLEAKNKKQREKRKEDEVLNFVIMEDLEYEARLRSHSNKTKGFEHGVHTEEPPTRLYESF